MGVEEQTSPSWSPVTKVIVALIALLGIGIIVYSFREALPPLVIAFFIAYLLTPIVNRISDHTRIPQGLVTLLIYLLFVIVVGLAIGLLMPAVVRQIAALCVDLQAVIETVEAFITREYVIGGYILNLTQFYIELRKELTGLIRPAMGQTLLLAMRAVTTLVWAIFISIISSLFLVAKYVYCKLLDLPSWPQEEGQPQMESRSVPGWLQAVWARVEDRVRRELPGGVE